MLKINKNTIVLYLIIIFFVFRKLFGQFLPFGDYYFILIIIGFITFFQLKIMIKGEYIKNNDIIFFNVVFLALIPFSYLMTGSLIIGIVGYLNITLMFSFWGYYFFFSNTNYNILFF